MSEADTAERVMELAHRADDLRRESARLIRLAARQARDAGLSQRQIAQLIGRSQPEVARLLRFSPSSPRGRRLAEHRAEVRKIARNAGLDNVRVFGSVARGEDHDGSDIDLLVHPAGPVSLFDLARAEQAIGALLGEKVDIVPDDALREPSAERIMAEAVAL